MACRTQRRCRPAAADVITRVAVAGAMLASLVAGVAFGREASGGNPCGVALRPLGAIAVPSGRTVDGALFGGISGIDVDPSGRRVYLVTDDRDTQRPPRVFIGRWMPAGKGPGRLKLQRSVRLAGAASDAESLRFDPQRREWLVALEGEPAPGRGPSVRRHALDGTERGVLALPPSLQADPAADRGPQANRSLEGLALEPGTGSSWLALEAPLRQDRAALAPAAGAALRFTRLDPATGQHAQYVYVADPAPARGVAPLADNGVSEILGGLGGRRLLVLERAGVGSVEQGFDFSARIYCADFSLATDVSALGSLEGAPWVPASKTLLLDLSGLVAARSANFEGMAWGPTDRRGRRSLLLASDDNFSAGVPTVVLVLEAGAPAAP